MSPRDRRALPLWLRVVSRVLIRGRHAEVILHDLADMMARDLDGGMWRPRALLRYARNLIASALSVWRTGLRVPRLGAVSWLDFKLGVRMLLKYPGLTFVGTLAMAWVIALAVLVGWFSENLMSPTLPFDQGERIVAIRNLDARMGWPYQWSSLDLLSWRDELESIEDLGAFRPFYRHLITQDGRVGPVESVQISAAAFRVARVPPALGRPLLEADEEAGASPVAVIGWDLWHERFGADPDVVGQTVRLGATTATVVGVMPSGFAFPVREQLWVPLRTGTIDASQRGRPSVNLFGRLAAGASMQSAQAELSGVAARTTLDASDEPPRPVLAPFPEIMRWGTGWSAPEGPPWPQLLLLLVAAANLGILVFARSAGRTAEISMRVALGASRTRIVSQMLVESLVLVSVASVGVLVVARWGLDRVQAFWDQFVVPVPFWWTPEISTRTVVNVAILTLVGAVVTGLLPALKVTRGAIASGLRPASTGGVRLRFGRLATGVIVAQVAISVGLLTLAVEQIEQDPVFVSAERTGTLATEDYLGMRVQMDDPTAPSDEIASTEFLGRYRAVREELARRTAAQPAVAGVTFASALPVGTPVLRRVEVEGAEAPLGSGTGHVVRDTEVDVDFLHVMRGSILSGRGFGPSPYSELDRGTVVVDDVFARALLGEREPVGHRLRYLSPGDSEPGPWLEIVGVVGDMGLYPGSPELRPAVYRPLDPARYGLYMVARLRDDASDFASDLRAMGAAVDPSLRLERLMTLDQAARESWVISRAQRLGLSLFGATALALCLAGIYALMSFTVAQRRREIGIRTALGAHPARVLAGVFGRALIQLGLGVVGGVALVTLGMRTGAADARGTLALVSFGMAAAGLLACALPTRRALSIEPTEALSEL